MLGIEDMLLHMLLCKSEQSAKTLLHPPLTQGDGNVDNT